MHTSVHIHVDTKYPLQLLSALFFETGSFVELEVYQLARLAGQWAQGQVCLPSPGLGSHWGSYVGAGTRTQFFKLLQQALSRPHF